MLLRIRFIKKERPRHCPVEASEKYENPMTNIRTISADQLTPAHIAVWSEIQQAEAMFDSPYFRPEFTQAVASVRKDVEVGILEDGGEPVGFFPFQRGPRNVALPVGGRMSDFHGVIVRKDVAWESQKLLRDCRLSAWCFDHLVAAQEPFVSHHWKTAPSPYLDLSQGWSGYQTTQQTLHRDYFKKAMRKLRHAEREAGPLRIEIDTRNQVVFQSLVQWKIDQYYRTGVTNVLAFDWTISLLQRMLSAKSEAFCGMMSALYMGNVLTAVVLSMRSYGVVHSWFSAYRPNFAPLSPGLILWLEIAKAYPALGVRRLDLGKGPETYKQHLMSGAIDVAEGAVDFRPLAGAMQRGWHRAYEWARCSPLRRPLLAPGRILRKMVESRSFR
jgi:CelD/BcsL family acetyltransferase involved in cellulose biosynthesis